MFRSLVRPPGWLRAVAFGLALALAGQVTAAADPREMKAREEFGAGRYDAALEIFAKLYAETLHPTYLRNVARCYQNLGQPEHAITSFREYLRKAKHVTADDRAEVEGYIKEMEALKKQQDEAAAAKPVAPVTPLPAAPTPPEAKETANAPTLVAQPTPESERHEESPSIFGRWWFWAAVVGVVGVGVGAAAAAGAFTHTQADPNCPTMMGYSCPPR